MENISCINILIFYLFVGHFCFVSGDVTVTQVTQPITHSEGPHWDSKNAALYFVNTFNATVLCWNSTSNTVASFKFEGRNSTSVIVPIQNAKGEFIVGSDRYLHRFEWDSTTNDTGKITDIDMIEVSKKHNYFNDGKADINGNLWIGTLSRLDDFTMPTNGGSFYRVLSTYDRGNVHFDVEEKIQNTSISNGLAFSKDNKTLFWIDSEEYKVFAFDVDLDSGTLGNTRRVVFDVIAHNLKGIPNGLTIDTNDDLWVAIDGGKAVVQVDSTSGELKRSITMPATFVTSVCFGGENMDVLFVTTSRILLNSTGLENEPLAGSVFAVTGLGVAGYPPNDVVVRESTIY